MNPDAIFERATECEEDIGGAALLCTMSKAANAARGCFSNGGKDDDDDEEEEEEKVSVDEGSWTSFAEILGENALC